jgi:ring-1,2-phenylacetyl-CoA epoxidase subunit PaaE
LPVRNRAQSWQGVAKVQVEKGKEAAEGGVMTVEVWLAGARQDLEIEPNETIFAAAHRAGLALPFSCLGGYCGACRATLEAGDVEMRVNRHLSEKQVARGLILTCQALPKGPGCRIRFDGA